MPNEADSSNAQTSRQTAPHRRSVLDLAPLELDCMNTLWPIGEGTVRDIRDRLAERRPRAYTTIMTIMDRLARKGIVERRKCGRAYVYRPHLTIEEARNQALGQVIDNFFSGSTEALLAQLTAQSPARAPLHRALAATASASQESAVPSRTETTSLSRAASLAVPASQAKASQEAGPRETSAPPSVASSRVSAVQGAGPPADESISADRIDDTLL